MNIRNKIKVDFYLEDGCSQEAGEANISWQPINFAIYSNLFIDLINQAIEEWLRDNTIKKHVMYEVIFAHVVERDGVGAVMDEHFERIYQESKAM